MLKVLSIKWEDEFHKSITGMLQDVRETEPDKSTETTLLFNGEPFPYGVQLEHLEGTEFENVILSALENEDIPKEEYTGMTQRDRLVESVKAQRNQLLSETDYLMQPDYPITEEQRNEVKVYRQYLRDITQQEGFPENMVWPEKPSFLLS